MLLGELVDAQGRQRFGIDREFYRRAEMVYLSKQRTCRLACFPGCTATGPPWQPCLDLVPPPVTYQVPGETEIENCPSVPVRYVRELVTSTEEKVTVDAFAPVGIHVPGARGKTNLL